MCHLPIAMSMWLFEELDDIKAYKLFIIYLNKIIIPVQNKCRHLGIIFALKLYM